MAIPTILPVTPPVQIVRPVVPINPVFPTVLNTTCAVTPCQAQVNTMKNALINDLANNTSGNNIVNFSARANNIMNQEASCNNFTDVTRLERVNAVYR